MIAKSIKSKGSGTDGGSASDSEKASQMFARVVKGILGPCFIAIGVSMVTKCFQGEPLPADITVIILFPILISVLVIGIALTILGVMLIVDSVANTKLLT